MRIGRTISAIARKHNINYVNGWASMWFKSEGDFNNDCELIRSIVSDLKDKQITNIKLEQSRGGGPTIYNIYAVY